MKRRKRPLPIPQKEFGFAPRAFNLAIENTLDGERITRERAEADRAQAITDGVQVDITTTAQEAGFRFPVFITRTAFALYVTVPPDVTGQDEAGRLWDVVWMLRFAIRKATPGQTRLPFALYVRNDKRAPRLIKLIATCGPLDLDKPEPAITIHLMDED